jgi:hypothetical protein
MYGSLRYLNAAEAGHTVQTTVPSSGDPAVARYDPRRYQTSVNLVLEYPKFLLCSEDIHLSEPVRAMTINTLDFHGSQTNGFCMILRLFFIDERQPNGVEISRSGIFIEERVNDLLSTCYGVRSSIV